MIESEGGRGWGYLRVENSRAKNTEIIKKMEYIMFELEGGMRWISLILNL